VKANTNKKQTEKQRPETHLISKGIRVTGFREPQIDLIEKTLPDEHLKRGKDSAVALRRMAVCLADEFAVLPGRGCLKPVEYVREEAADDRVGCFGPLLSEKVVCRHAVASDVDETTKENLRKVRHQPKDTKKKNNPTQAEVTQLA
jgi:hypothetical protein